MRTGFITIHVFWMAAVVGPASAPASESPSWRGPRYLQFETGGTLLVACEKSGTVARIDPADGSILREVRVDDGPFVLVSHPDGKRLYVSCRRADTIVELTADSLDVLRRFELRGDPTGLAVSADGRVLYAGVHSLDALAVFDLQTETEVSRLMAGNGPEYITREPSSGRLYLSNLLSNPVGPEQPPVMEITVIDDSRRRVVRHIDVVFGTVGRYVAFTSDGSLGLTAVTRPRNLIPFTQVARGWCMSSGVVVLRPQSGAPPITLLLDQPNRAFPDPHGVVILPDDSKAYITCAAADKVVVLDLVELAEVADEAAAGKIPFPGDNLGLSRRYVIGRIAVGINPTAIAVSPDGRFVYVANRLEDSISVIDAASDAVLRTMVLGTPPKPDTLALGERYFHTVRASFQQQIGCISCHPDTGFDGLTWDLEPDGIGLNAVDNRNLRGVAGTGPFKWNGKNPDLATQCGTRTAKWIFRTQGFSAIQVSYLAKYIRSLNPVTNPHRLSEKKLTPAQRRGKTLYERTTLNNGEPLPVENRCTTCHSGPKFSDYQSTDVSTRGPRDTTGRFDNAHLVNVFESAPYLHDGRARTLEEIWTKHNRDDRHGYSSDWTQKQLNDLVEYLKSL